MNSFQETEALRDDAFAESFVLTKIQDSLQDISRNLGLENVGLPKLSIDFSSINFTESFDTKEDTKCENLNSITEKLNQDQSYVVNCIMNEIPPGVTVDDPYAPVTRPFRHKFDRSRSFFLDALRGTAKTFTIRAIQPILRLRGQKFIAVATFAIAALPLENGRTAHSTFGIPIPCFSEVSAA